MIIFLDQLKLIRHFEPLESCKSRLFRQEMIFLMGVNQMNQGLSLDWAIMLKGCDCHMLL